MIHKNTVISVSDIKWDSGTNALPLEVEYLVPYDMEMEELEDNLSDYLSDKYGYCHLGFKYE